MPRTARAAEAGMVYHVLNRGNGRMRLFHKPGDYEAFEQVLAEGLARYPVELFTYAIMPNHWHLVVRPTSDGALGRWMGWIGVTHVRRHHEHYHRRGGGHLYQGRFKSFPVAEDEYFLTLCRYVEANPLRARLVERADAWPWSGLARRAAPPRAGVGRLAGSAPAPLGRPSKRCVAEGSTGRRASVRPARATARPGRLGSGNRRPPGPRLHPPQPRPPAKNRETVMAPFSGLVKS